MRIRTVLQKRGVHRRSVHSTLTVATVCGALVLLASGPAHAAPLLPNIPANQYNVLDFGARGDGVSNNTTAIQNTINAAAATGGTVEIPAGTYLSGPFTLASRINLQIDSGATLKMLPIGIFTNYAGGTDHFISIANMSDVEISGSGTIDGNGAGWWSPLAATRPYMVYFNGGCSRVLIQNITLQNPPKMHIVFKGADFDITIQGITINTTTAGAKNTDGIDQWGQAVWSRTARSMPVTTISPSGAVAPTRYPPTSWSPIACSVSGMACRLAAVQPAGYRT